MITNNTSNVTHLQMDSKILLHTRLAQSMFNYSWQHGKMGLLQFAKLTSNLWKATHQDDPYADWVLLKTYQALINVREQLQELEKQFSEQLSTIRGIETTPALNITPISYPLKFSNYFGYMGATLLADADYVLRQILTLKRLGKKQDDINLINQVVKYLQDVFAIPRQWHQTGVTRVDIKENTQKAQEVIALLGEVPDSIVQQKIDFNFLSK